MRSPAPGLIAGLLGPQHGRDPPLGLDLESARVGAQALPVGVVVLPPEPRGGPQFADRDLAEQVVEAQAVVLVGVGQDEHRQVGLAVDDWQGLDEPVDDRHLRSWRRRRPWPCRAGRSAP
jgi:hypothetical protein